MNTKSLTELAPHDLIVEEVILYCITFGKIKCNTLEEEDFYNIENRDAFAWIKQNKIYDPILIDKQFKARIRNTAGQGYLTSDFDSYLRKLKDFTALRKIRSLMWEASVKIKEGKGSDEVKRIIKKIEHINTGSGILLTKQTKEISDQFEEYMSMDISQIIKTGYDYLDREIDGFFPGNFVAIGGVPKVGKTTFMLNILRNIIKQDKKVLLVSLEMTEADIQAKLISMMTGINIKQIRGVVHTFDQGKIDKIRKANQELASWKLYRLGKEGVTIDDIEREIINIGGVDIVFIDYLQKLRVKNSTSKRYDQVTQLSADIKEMAMRLNIPVVCIVSINREFNTRVNKRPKLTDFRDSGNIEYDVDMALMLYRDEEEDPTTTECIIAASRFGEGNTIIKFTFKPEQSRFYQIQRGNNETICTQQKIG